MNIPIDDVEMAIGVARQWVDLIDKGDTGAAWATSSPILRRSISLRYWAIYIDSTREALGAPVARAWLGVRRHVDAAVSPKKECLIVLFETAYSSGTFHEQVVLHINAGKWVPVRFAVRPITSSEVCDPIAPSDFQRLDTFPISKDIQSDRIADQ
ncbi:DUF4019 domain-containing protein [Burkholderia pyrrocinia]|uniref:DUF4019 domain-containing protein n=1 Tax=Burkholderia pyrrocinia TaxID=60550 RepID=A0ABZ3BN39_BURPY